MVEKTKDLPWPELLAKANQAIKKGATLYQKFTCENCGARQTMSIPNAFYISGECEECKHVTDIQKNGGGYLATFGITGDNVMDIFKDMKDEYELRKKQ